MTTSNNSQPPAAGAPKGEVAAHTPTPWRAIVLSRQIEHEKPNQYGYPIKPVGGNFLIATVTLAYPALNGDHNKLDYAQGEANAAFIVRACNAYDSDQRKIKALVEGHNGIRRALRAIFPGFESDVKNPDESVNEAYIMLLQEVAKMDAALALAKEGQ